MIKEYVCIKDYPYTTYRTIKKDTILKLRKMTYMFRTFYRCDEYNVEIGEYFLKLYFMEKKYWDREQILNKLLND